MTVRTCESCGEPNPPRSEFCAACGSYLGWQESEPGPPPRRPAAREPETRLLPGIPRTGSARPAAPPHRRPPPARRVTQPSLSPAPAPAATIVCAVPSCATASPADRRFCSRCGADLAAGRSAATVADANAAGAGWRHLLSPRARSSLAARRAYRRSLPARYRARRIVAGVVAVVVVVGLASVLTNHPVAWARAQWFALRDSMTPVTGVRAATAPLAASIADDPAAAAIDGNPDTVWATTWGGRGASGTRCALPLHGGGKAFLDLLLPTDTTIRGIKVASGLPTNDLQRALQWRPTSLDLVFGDGSCQRILLADIGGLQLRKLAPVTTTIVRIEIATAAAPPAGSPPLVTIGEVQLLRRRS